MVIGAKKNLVGLDIDTEEVRAVELSGTKESPVLKGWGREPLPQGAFEDGLVNQPDEVAKALSALWAKNNLKAKDVVLGVANNEVLVRFATFQKVPEEKLGGLIRHQAQDFMPIPLNNAILDYTVIGETTGETGAMYEVILVAARKDMINEFINALAKARLKAREIDVSSLVLLKNFPIVQREGATVLIDIANGQGNILVVANQVPRLARRLQSKLKDAAAYLNISVDEIFSHPDLAENPPESYLGWTDELVGEIRSSISYYQAQKDALAVEEIVLSGKGARAPQVVQRLEEVLNIPVRKVKPFSKLQGYNPGSNSQDMDYNIAMSLALRGLEG